MLFEITDLYGMTFEVISYYSGPGRYWDLSRFDKNYVFAKTRFLAHQNAPKMPGVLAQKVHRKIHESGTFVKNGCFLGFWSLGAF